MSKYIIIGGVAGGASAVARLRRIDEQSQIILFEKGAYISYANCGLPYYIGGVISDREKLFVQTPISFAKRFNVDVRVQQEVISIHPDEKKIAIKNLQTGEEYTETYDKLVLSPGAEPIKPPLPGIDLEGIFTLRNVPDTDNIKSYINKNKIRRAVVIGAGFIGLEMAENLHHLGVQVTIVEMANQMMNPIDFSMATLVHQHLKTKNVEFYLKDGVSSFERTLSGLVINLNSGRKLAADMVVLSIGVKADSKLARNAGLTVGETGGITVNKYLQTSNPDIYAVGDAIEFDSPITGKKTITYLAGPANKQGRIVANNLVNNNSSVYNGSISTAIAKVFDLTVASTGLPAKRLQAENVSYISSITHASSHAGYYPQALPMTIKITFDPVTGKLFGAQIVGYEGVDKRCDLFASVIKNNGTVFDLIEIEHAYAPPYSSAKDPVNIAGMVAENIIKGKVKIIAWHELLNNQENYFVIDVRTPEEFQLGCIPGAVNIPIDNIREQLNQIPKNRKVVLYCGVGLRAYLGTRILYQSGYTEVYNLSGGYKIYEHAIMKQSNEDIFEKDFIGNDDHIYQSNPDKTMITNGNEIIVDACGLQCPGPIRKLKEAFDTIQNGDTINISATDPGFAKDVKSWCNVTGNQLIELKEEKGTVKALVQKLKQSNIEQTSQKLNGQTIVVFSDDLDKAIATFIIANGGASSGKKVTLFFTFWGLSIIKKQEKPKVKKDFMGKMFSFMLPSSSKKLVLSKMNMGGLGTMMLRQRMQAKQVDTLQSLIQQAQQNNIEMIACNMSMDIMGIKPEELMDNVELGGVASYIDRASDAGINLFI